jgi:uncharacterized membrane protein YdjX (TVP38/TMEM64 family)
MTESVLGTARVSGAHDRVNARAHTRRTALVRIGALAAVLLALTIVGYRLGWFDARRVMAFVQHLQTGRTASSYAVVFVLVATAATAIGFPALPFTVAGGALFGHLLGSALSWSAALLGSMIGYWLARGIGRDTARRWLARRTVGEAFTQSTSFQTLLYLRLVPVVPLSVVNFTAGFARTRFGTYVVATAIGILPTTIVFAYFADSLVRGLQGAKAHAYGDIAIASVLLLVLSLVPWVVRRYRRGR